MVEQVQVQAEREARQELYLAVEQLAALPACGTSAAEVRPKNMTSLDSTTTDLLLSVLFVLCLCYRVASCSIVFSYVP